MERPNPETPGADDVGPNEPAPAAPDASLAPAPALSAPGFPAPEYAEPALAAPDYAAPAPAPEFTAPGFSVPEYAAPEAALAAGAEPEPPALVPAPPPTLRERAIRGFDRAAALAAGISRVALRRAPPFVAIAAAPVVAIWPLLEKQRPALTDNALLDLRERLWLLGSFALSAALLGGAAFWTARRHRADGPGAAALAVTRLQDRLLPLLVLPFLPPLALTEVETARPVFTLALVALAAAATALAVYRAPASPRLAAAFAPDAALSRFAPLAGLLVLAAGYATVFSLFSVGQHHALATKVHDLAIYDNIFWQSAHGNPLGSSFVRGGNHVAAHFDPLLILLSPLYLLAPRSETILILQSLWLASAAIPLFLIGRRHLGPWAGLALAAIWVLYPAVHGANLYDFHSLTLIAPLVPWALHLADAGHVRRYAVVLGLLLLAREDVSLLVGFLGLHLLLSGKARLGLATIVAAVFWLGFAKLVVMPDPGLLMNDSAESYAYAYYYRDLIPKGLGTFGILSTLLANPLFALGNVLKDEKVLFFLRLFLPLLFLPFLAPKGRIVLAYGLAFCLLASKSAVYSLHFQYAVLIFPAAIALVPPALARIRDGYLADKLGLDGPRLARGLLAGAVVATALVSLEYGALVPNASFKAGPEKFVRTRTPEMEKRYAVVRKAVALIPPGASVGATDHLGPHVSNRKQAYMFPGPRTEYLLVELKDPKVKKEIQQLRAGGELEALLEEEGISLFRRVPKPAAPAPVSPPAAIEGAAPAGRLAPAVHGTRGMPGLIGLPARGSGANVLPAGHDEPENPDPM